MIKNLPPFTQLVHDKSGTKFIKSTNKMFISLCLAKGFKIQVVKLQGEETLIYYLSGDNFNRIIKLFWKILESRYLIDFAFGFNTLSDFHDHAVKSRFAVTKKQKEKEIKRLFPVYFSSTEKEITSCNTRILTLSNTDKGGAL